MPAIVPAFTTIPPADIDPDSPVTTNLMAAIVDNEEFLSQWIGTRDSTTIPHHRHKATVADGTVKILYADIDGTPASTGVSSAMFSATVDVPAGSGSVIYDTGALGFTPKAMTILTGSGVVTGGFPDEAWDGMATSDGSQAARAEGITSPTLNVIAMVGTKTAVVSQFNSTGIQITFEANTPMGNDLRYVFVMQVIGT